MACLPKLKEKINKNSSNFCLEVQQYLLSSSLATKFNHLGVFGVIQMSNNTHNKQMMVVDSQLACLLAVVGVHSLLYHLEEVQLALDLWTSRW